MNHQRYVRSFALSLLGLAAAYAAAETGATRPAEGLREHTPEVFALTGGRIVVAPSRVIERGTIIVRDGIIEAVGEEIEPPADARRIDLEGKTVYAGLIDAYSEIGTPKLSSRGGSPHWNAQITPQRSAAENYEQNAALNEKLRGQGIAARLVAPESGILKGTSALVSTGDEPNERAILSAEVAQHARLTVPFRRSREEYPGSPMGAVALARQTMLDADWYKTAWAAARADRTIPSPDRNDALEALDGYSGNGKLMIVDAQNELYFLRADRFAREFAVKIAVRGSGDEYRRLAAIRETGRPVIVPINFPKPPAVASIEAARGVSLEELMHWDLAPENPARLQEAGVRIAITSHGLDDVKQFLAAVRKAVARGLDADAALAALTTTPAELFGVSDRLGTIESGKLASLVVADGDLFAKETKVLQTWVAGKQFEIAAVPLLDVRGTWKAEVRPKKGKPQELVIEISGTAEKPAGKIVTEVSGEQKEGADAAEGIKLDKLEHQGARLAFTFDGKPLERDGVVQASVVVSIVTDGAATWLGSAVFPDGESAALTATRVDKDVKSTEQEGKTEETTPDAGPSAKKQGKKKKKGKDDGRLKKENPPGAPGGGEGAPKEGAPLTEPPADEEEGEQPAPRGGAAKNPGSSFDVNFPLGAFGVKESLPRQDTVAFVNATVWTCGEAGRLEGATVLVARGLIEAVGADIEIPKGAVIVDCRGRHVTPGIIDCHSHMATDGGVNEGTQAITAEVRIGDFIDCDDVTIYRQLAGGVTASNILHGSANPIGGQNQVIKLRWGALPEEMKFREAPQGIKFALGENVKQSNWGDDYTTRYPQTRMGVEQIIRDEFREAERYAQSQREWSRSHQGLPPRRDLELDAIAEILAGRRWVHCHSYRQDEILALIRTLDDFEITIGTFQHILEGYKVADEMARHGAMGSAFSDWWAYKFEVYDAIPYAGALMHDAGVVVSFNSDDRELGRRLNTEAAKAVKYGGVPPEEALKFVTLNPAKQLRIDQYVGSLEPGKHADLVVWSGDPLSTLSRCEETWIDGRRCFSREEDAKRRADVRRMRQALIQKILASGEAMRGEEEESGEDDSHLWPREDEYCHGHGHGHGVE